jgi:hypothetical protein
MKFKFVENGETVKILETDKYLTNVEAEELIRYTVEGRIKLDISLESAKLRKKNITIIDSKNSIYQFEQGDINSFVITRTSSDFSGLTGYLFLDFDFKDKGLSDELINDIILRVREGCQSNVLVSEGLFMFKLSRSRKGFHLIYAYDKSELQYMQREKIKGFIDKLNKRIVNRIDYTLSTDLIKYYDETCSSSKRQCYSLALIDVDDYYIPLFKTTISPYFEFDEVSQMKSDNGSLESLLKHQDINIEEIPEEYISGFHNRLFTLFGRMKTSGIDISEFKSRFADQLTDNRKPVVELRSSTWDKYLDRIWNSSKGKQGSNLANIIDYDAGKIKVNISALLNRINDAYDIRNIGTFDSRRLILRKRQTRIFKELIRPKDDRRFPYLESEIYKDFNVGESPDVREKVRAAIYKILDNNFLEPENIDDVILKDDSKSSYLNIRSGNDIITFQVTKDRIEPYTGNKYIFDHQIISLFNGFTFNPNVNLNKWDPIEKYFTKITHNWEMLRLILGYLSHHYNSSINSNKYVVISDGNNASGHYGGGGTGKTTLTKYLKFLNNVAIIDSKGDKFDFDSVDESTHIICIDDADTKFDLKMLRQYEGSTITIRRKNKDSLKIKPTKVMITTNYDLLSLSNSETPEERRMIEINISNFFGEKTRSLVDYLGYRMWDDSRISEDSDWWSCYIKFYLTNLKLYLQSLHENKKIESIVNERGKIERKHFELLEKATGPNYESICINIDHILSKETSGKIQSSDVYTPNPNSIHNLSPRTVIEYIKVYLNYKAISWSIIRPNNKITIKYECNKN